jgi:cathepsin L
MFRSLLLSSALLCAAQAKQLTEVSSDYDFSQFLVDFKLQGQAASWSPEEHSAREELFREQVNRVRQHNAQKHSYKIAVNKYSAMTAKEKRSMLGHNKAVRQAHAEAGFKHQLPSGIVNKKIEDLPTSVDWRNTPNVVSAVKDQGHCGSCWAFSATETLESHIALSTGLLYDLSPQQIAMCTPNPESCGGTGGCYGATTELGFEYVAESGIVEEYQIGYYAYQGENSNCAFNRMETPPVATIQGYTKLAENNYEDLMNAIAQVGPVAIVVDASEWHNYAGGIFNGCNQENPDLNHGVVLVGYGEEASGEKYWIIRNSWSPSYGEQGYIRVARSDQDNELCGIDVTPLDGTACNGDTTPVKVCGTCGVLYDSSYPIGAALS